MTLKQSVQGASLLVLLAVAGCSVNATVTDSCSTDSAVTCANGQGYSCTGSVTPDSSTLLCSDGTPGAGTDGATGFCCIDIVASSTCANDDTVTCPTPGSFGFSCTGTDAPSVTYTNLTCSTGTPVGSDTQYCCTD